MENSNLINKTADEINDYNQSKELRKEHEVVKYKNECEYAINLVNDYIESEMTRFIDGESHPCYSVDTFRLKDIDRMKSNSTIACYLEEAVNECKNDRSIDSGVQAKKTIIKIMGYRLKQVRTTEGIPLKTFASDMGISVSLLNKYEKGRNENIMPYRNFHRLHFDKKISFHYLLGLSRDKNRDKDGNLTPMVISHVDFHALSKIYELYNDIFIGLDIIFALHYGQEDIEEIMDCLKGIIDRLK